MYEYKAKVINVVDGDTVDMIVDLGFYHTFEQRFRLYGIDTPERGQEGYAEAKGFLAELVRDKNVVIRTLRNTKGAEQVDKYGRWLVQIYLPVSGVISQDVNTTLVREGYAKPYYP